MPRIGPEKVGLPVRPFFYTLDQVSSLLSIQPHLLEKMIFFEGRTIVVKQKFHLWAVNLAGPNDKPQWRIMERELIRWMNLKGIEVTESRSYRGGKPSRSRTFRSR